MTDKKIDEADVFNAARKIEDADAREEYLRQACGDDEDLRERVAQLLSKFDEQPSFLASPPVGEGATLDMPAITEKPGTVIGHYKLLQQIGEGGFGVVYMADQVEPVRRRVALKIIKPGMDSRQVVARFEAERQALAMMDHQNIARVLDAGTTDSARPYFVMELVKGVPITEYCDSNKLAPRERLELFIPVCQAIQHAHQKGIIHRDIKPSNVLVCLYDGKPVAKVIDFGVAKAIEQRLTEKTMFTQHGQIVGTLEYMSPEQAELSQLDIDTRSDIYSLGVLLYELLTGTTPITKQQLREAGFTEMLRLIRETEPEKPSTRLSQSHETLPTISAQRRTEPKKLSLLVKGELDWIVMKALEKDRTRRYDSASAFAADVQRHLDDEPVEACPPSVSYRLQKFARRNKRLIVTAVTLTAIMVIATTVSVNSAIRAHSAIRGERWARKEREIQLRLTETERNRAVSAEQIATQRLKELHKEKQRTDEERDRAVEAEKQAKASAAAAVASSEETQDTLARSLFEQARAVRLAHQGGHRWQALELLKRSESLRNRKRQTASTASQGDKTADDADSISLPSQADIRSEAVAALLLADGRVHRQWNGMYQSISPDGQFAAVFEMNLTRQPPEMSLRQVDLETGKDVKRWNRPKMAGGAIALGPGGKLLATAGAPGNVTVRLWDTATGQVIKTLQTPALSTQLTPVPKLIPPPAIKATPAPPKTPPNSDQPKPKRNPGVRKTAPKSTSSKTSVNRAQRSQPPVSKGDNPATDKPVGAKPPKTGRDQPRTKQAPSGFGGFLQKLAFSPDGRYLGGIVLTGAESHVILWNLSGETMGQEVGSARGVPLSNLSFSRDSSLLVFPSGKNHVTVWDIQKQESATKIDVPMADMIGLVSFSNDGRLLAMNGYTEKGEQSATIVWDLEHDREQQRFTTGIRVFTVLSFNADATRLAVADMAGRIVVYRLDEGREEFRLDHGSMPQLLRWGNDGKRLYSGGMGSLKEWELAVDRPLRVFRVEGKTPVVLSQFDFSPNGEWLAFGGPGRTVRLYHWPTGASGRSLKLTGGGGTVRFSPDSRRLAVHGFTGATVIDAETGEKLGRIAADYREQKFLYSTAFTEEGRCLVAGTDQGRPTVRDVKTGEILWQTGKADRTVAAVAMLSPDGRLVATWKLKFSPILKSASKEMELWDLKSKQVIHRLPPDLETASATFSPRGRWLAVVSGGGMMARMGGRLLGGPAASAQAAVFGSNEDWSITLWNTQTGKQHFKTRGPLTEIITFSPDGRLLAIRYRGGAVDLWNVQQKERLFRWSLPEQGAALLSLGSHLTFTADGRFLAASVGATGGIHLLDLTRLEKSLAEYELGW